MYLSFSRQFEIPNWNPIWKSSYFDTSLKKARPRTKCKFLNLKDFKDFAIQKRRNKATELRPMSNLSNTLRNLFVQGSIATVRKNKLNFRDRLPREAIRPQRVNFFCFTVGTAGNLNRNLTTDLIFSIVWSSARNLSFPCINFE